MKPTHFSFEDGRTTQVAYFDGYDFGDRLLEGVPFKATILSNGKIQIQFAFPKGEYERQLNQKHWIKEAKEFAEEEDNCDSYNSDPDLASEGLVMEFEV
jgi:hypothetical protein